MSGMSVIYRLTDSNNHFYIGSTSNLKQRLPQHRNSRHNASFSRNLCDDWRCDILEHTDKVGHDLLWLERKYFDTHYGNPLFVNKQRPIITEEELKAYLQQYRDQNKDKMKAYNQQYREQNKDKHKVYKGQKLHCECGAVVRRDYMTKHLRTNKHLNRLNQKTPIFNQK